MPKSTTTQVVITANASVAEKVMTSLKTKADELKKAMSLCNQATAEGVKAFRQLQQEFNAYNSVIRESVTNTERVDKVMADLSNTKLKDLRRALGAAKKALGEFTENNNVSGMKKMQDNIKALQNQIKLLEGEFVNIKKHMGELPRMSDAWLNKAIQQQQQMLMKTREGTAAYQQQEAQLKRLNAEQTRRAVATINSGTATASQLTAARGVVANAKNSLAVTDTKGIAAMNNVLLSADKQLDTFKVKAQEAGISWQRMRQVMQNPLKANGNDIKATMDAIQQKMATLPAGSKRVEQLRAKFKELDGVLKGTKNDIVDVANVLKNIKSASFNQLQAAAKQLEAEINSLTRTDQKHNAELQRKQQQLKQLRGEMASISGSASKMGGAFATTLRNLSAYFGLFTMISKAIQTWHKFIDLNMKLSDALTDIRKVSGLATDDINKLSQSLAKIDTRSSVEELNKVAYAGAKLGMGKYGIEGLEGFTKAANQVNVALKEDLGDEALTQLSKFTEVMGLIPKLGVERSMLKVGSAMFKLSSTSTATSKGIVAFSQRMTGMARTAGITADQILALGSAADSMMLKPEVAATAFSKLIAAFQRHPGAVEKALGMPKGRINELFKTHQSMQAIVEILEKLHGMGNMNKMGGVFKDLGSDGSRLINVMVTMSKNVDMLKQHLATSKEAFSEGTAVTTEYNMQQETAEALMERASNMWEKAFVNPKGVDNVKGMAVAWYQMSKYLTQNEGTMKVFNGVLTTLLTIIKSLIAVLPGLLAGLMFKGVASILIGLRSAFIGVGEASLFAGGTLKSFVTNLRGMKAAMMVNWVAAFIAILSELYIVFEQLSNKTKKANTFMQGFKTTVDAMDGSFRKTSVEAQALYKAILRSAEGTRERAALINQFNKNYGQYLDKMLTEKSSAQELAKAYAQVNSQLKQKSLLELKQKDYDTYYTPALGRSKDRLETYRKLGGNDTWLDAYINDAIMTQTKKGGLKMTDGSFSRALAAKMGGISAEAQQYAQKQRGSTYVPAAGSVLQTTTLNGLTPVTKSHKFTAKEVRYIAAVQAANQYYATAHIHSNLFQKWGPDNNFEPQDDLGELEDTSNNGNGGLKPEGPERPETPEDPLEKAKKLISEQRRKIQAFYEQQMTAMKEDMASRGDVTQEEVNAFLKGMQMEERKALDAFETSIYSGDNSWGDFANNNMPDDLKDQESFALMNEITGADVMGMRNLALTARPKGWKAQKGLVTWINKKGKEQTGRGTVGWANRGFKPEDDKNLFMAQMLYDSSRQDNKQADIALQQALARAKEIQEHDYTGIVKTNSVDGLLTTGLMDSSIETFDKDKNFVIDTLEKSRAEMVKVIESNGNKEDILKLLFGEDYETKLKGSSLEPLLNANEKEFQLFYSKLIQYSDEYTEAEKKAYQEHKKNVEFLWKQSGGEANQSDRSKALSEYNSMYGEKVNYGSTMGFSYNAYDPELASYRLKMEAAREYYDFVKTHTNDVLLQREAEQAALQAQDAYTQQMVARMKTRLERLKDFMQPTETAIESIGEAWAEFRTSTEDGQKAMINALKTFIKQYGTMLISNLRKVAEQSITRKVTSNIIDRQAEIQPAKAGEKRKGNKTADVVADVMPTAVKAADEFIPASNVPGTNVNAKRVGGSGEEYTPDKLPKQAVEKSGENTSVAVEEQETVIPEDKKNPDIFDASNLGDGMLDATDPVAAQNAIDDALLAEAQSYHAKMLEEEKWYQDAIQKLKDDPSANLEEMMQQHEQETAAMEQQESEKQDIKSQGYAALRKVAQKGGQNLLSLLSGQNKKEEKNLEGTISAETDIRKVGATEQYDVMSVAETGISSAMAAASQSRQATEQTEASSHKASLMEQVVGEVVCGIAGGGAKTVEQLGWWGIPLVAVISASLMALLNWALGQIGGGSSSDSSAATNTKLVSGMLTYDEGNVGQYVGTDGKVYTARDAGALPGGVSMVSSPIATTVNGQPSLVAENGPEIVVGRETTAAMMQNAPQLLSMLAAFDKTHTLASLGLGNGRMALFDDGNLTADAAASATVSAGSAADSSANTALMQQLLYYLQNPVAPNINMYGRNGLHSKIQQANQFMNGK